MKSNIERKFGSVIYDSINSVRMSETERQAAMNAMRDADAIVDAILWIGRKAEQLGSFILSLKPSPSPSLKH